MEIKEMEIGALKPYANNPRNNDKAVEAVAESIREFGFKVPIVIDKDGTIVAGHTRYKAAQRLGLKSVPCIVADDLTPEQVKAFRLADNKTAELAEWDFNALEKELHDLEGILDMENFGFPEEQGLSEESLGEDFELPDGDKPEFVQITFSLHERQAELVRRALDEVGECQDTFGNPNKKGNALYQALLEWEAQRN